MCLTSSWMDSYWGGAVPAIGGALVIGAVPGVSRRGKVVSGVILGSGAVILLSTRPFEGVMLLIPVALYLITVGKAPGTAWAAIGLVVASGIGWLGYYNYRVTGSSLRLPYVEYDRQYPSTSHFNFLPLPKPAGFRHADFRAMDTWERGKWARSRTVGFLSDRVKDLADVLGAYLGSLVLIVPVGLLWPQLSRDRRLRLFRWCLAGMAVTVATEVVYYTHYAAPFLAAILVVTVQAFRHLRQYHGGPKAIGRWLCRGLVMAMLVLWAGHEGLRISQRRPVTEKPANSEYQAIEESLQQEGLSHLIFVRYTRYLDTTQGEWIHNRADIDNSPVVWAQDRGPVENRRLMEYMKGRSAWLFLPDEDVRKLTPYDPGTATVP
jgi:hypothetical protein